MNLDDQSEVLNIDKSGRISIVQGIPNRLKQAWETRLTANIPLPSPMSCVVLIGRDERAVGAEIFRDYVSRWCRTPVLVNEGYQLPAWVQGAGVFVIGLGGTEDADEVADIVSLSKSRGCPSVCCCFGVAQSPQTGRSAEYPCEFQVSAAQGGEAVEIIGFLAGLFSRWGLIPNQSKIIETVIDRLTTNQGSYGLDIPVNRNPAKRAAGQMVGRRVVVFGSDHLAPVARRWKIQLNRMSKSWSQYETIPGAEYHTPSGLFFPDGHLSGMLTLFLRGSKNHPKNLDWLDAIRKLLMQQGINTDFFNAAGDTLFEQIFSALQFGEYTAYYLAIANGIDPEPVDIRTYLESKLKP